MQEDAIDRERRGAPGVAIHDFGHAWPAEPQEPEGSAHELVLRRAGVGRVRVLVRPLARAGQGAAHQARPHAVVAAHSSARDRREPCGKRVRLERTAGLSCGLGLAEQRDAATRPQHPEQLLGRPHGLASYGDRFANDKVGAVVVARQARQIGLEDVGPSAEHAGSCELGAGSRDLRRVRLVSVDSKRRALEEFVKQAAFAAAVHEAVALLAARAFGDSVCQAGVDRAQVVVRVGRGVDALCDNFWARGLAPGEAV